jgi:hypothetical protein
MNHSVRNLPFWWVLCSSSWFFIAFACNLTYFGWIRVFEERIKAIKRNLVPVSRKRQQSAIFQNRQTTIYDYECECRISCIRDDESYKKFRTKFLFVKKIVPALYLIALWSNLLRKIVYAFLLWNIKKTKNYFFWNFHTKF